MNPEQFQLFLEDNRKSTAEAIKLTVNGKIDRLREELHERNDKIKADLELYNSLHAKDMEKILPVIEAFAASQRFAKDAKASGKGILWIAGFITAVGSAYLIIKNIFHF